MMLLEHVKLLREWYAEDNYVPEPKLDEYDLEELANQIQSAVQTQSIVRVQYWKNGEAFTIEGTIKALPVNSYSLTLLSPQGNKQIHIPHIMKIHAYIILLSQSRNLIIKCTDLLIMRRIQLRNLVLVPTLTLKRQLQTLFILRLRLRSFRILFLNLLR